MEWKNDAIFEFLSLYENEPALWNTKCASHKNRNDQYDAWSRIQSKLTDGIVGNMSIKEIKKKRDNLMSTYRKLRSKKETMKGTDEIFKPDWPFYNVMSTFLDDVYIPRKTKNFDDSEIKEEFEEIDNENYNVETNGKMQVNDDSEEPFHTSKRLRIPEPEKELDEAYYVKQTTQIMEKDYCSLYTELLCRKLRGLHEKTREIAMLEIDKLIFHLKQNETKIMSSYTCSSDLQLF